MDEIRILLVDDDASVARGMAHLLGRAGYATATAANGFEALQALPAFRPHLVLSDRDMPEMDGLEFCRRLKSDPTWADVFVVLISSSFTQSEEQAAGLDLGADGYIARPIANRELLARVAAYARILRLNLSLRRSEAHFRAVTDSAIDAIITLAADGRIVDWNQGARRMFGYEEQEICGQPMDRLIPSGYREWHIAGLARLQSGEARHVIGKTVELAGVRKDGSEFPLELGLSEWEGGAGRFFTGIIRDISERKQAEQERAASEARFRALFDDAPVGYHEIDRKGRLVRVNHTELFLLGYTEEEMLGRPVAEFTLDPEKSAAAVQAKLQGSGVSPTAFERQVRRKDGSLLDVIINDKLIFDPAGHITGIRSSLQDNTAAKLAEAQLRKLSAAVEQSPASIVITDVHGNIEYTNPKFTAVTGYSREEAAGQNPRLLKSGERSADEYRKLWTTIVAGGTWHGEFHNKRKDGTLYWEDANISGIRDSLGRVTHFLALKTDVTARKQAEQELRAAKEAAEAAVVAKGEFLANMSHEIRTPMNGVIGMTGLLLDTKLTREQRQFAESVRNSAENLMTVINDILDFSKIEAGKLIFEVLDFDLVETLESTLDMLAERAQGKGVELIDGIAPEVPTRLRGDPGRLRQVLTNLLGNAIKFTEHGEVVVRVGLESETTTHAVVRFSVVDTGIGIPPAVQARLFQSFSQADSSTTRRYGGTGLGLAISKQLVALMQGNIGVQSEVGRGSTFWFTAQFEKQTGDPKPVRIPAQDLINLRVLVVDDNATNRQILRHQIFAWKMQKGSAAGGFEALKILRAAAAAGNPYDLALLDMQMPEMDGMTLAKAIKADPVIASTRLIMLTSLGHRFEPEQLKAVGLDAYLVKPVKQSRLFDCLADVMGSSPPADHAEAPPPLVAAAPFPRRHVLVAEDNQVNQKIAVAQLKRLGCTVDVAANGLEVLEALPRVSYDLVFMDCQMPEMDGYEATAAIRRREADAVHRCRWRTPVRIIAMTANAMQGDREKCIAAGMDDYVSKPIRPAELQAAIERAVPPES